MEDNRYAVVLLVVGIFAAYVTAVYFGGDNNVDPDLTPIPNPPSNKVQALANAIANAEGFNVANSLPQRDNNPGDLELTTEQTGYPTDQGKTVFPDANTGWSYLYNQVNRMLTGTSAVYDPSMTFQEMAEIYTGGDSPDTWVAAVCQPLGVTPQTTLAQYANS